MNMHAHLRPHHSRPALTMIELLLSVALSSMVMLSALSLVSAYGYASSEIYDLRPLRSEAINVHAYVQDWLKRARDIIAVTSPITDQVVIDDPGVKESGLTRLYAYMGERPGRVDDGKVVYDEIEVLVWQYNWDVAAASGSGGTALLELLDSWGTCSGCPSDLNGDGAVDGEDLALLLDASGGSDPAFRGTLKRFYYMNENTTQVLDSKLNDNDLTANWFAGNPDSELWSDNVYRFTAELLSDGTKSPSADVKITLLDLSQVKADPGMPNGVNVPLDYSISVTGTPDTYVQAVGF